VQSKREVTAYISSPRLLAALARIGIKELYPPQILALEAGLLESRESFVVAAPTASGKTLIAELAALQVFFETGGKVLYLVPLRALAREKYTDFSRKYRDLGLRVMLSTGDYDSAAPWLHQADLLVTTNEKLDSLIRHRAAWLNDLSLVVADEIHLLGDPHRGPTLEVVLTRLRSLNPQLRVIALSATIPNAREIAAWLGARLVQSDWRPVPLREGVYFNGAAIFNDGTVKWVPEASRIEALDLALDTVREGGQAVIFVSTRKSTEVAALKAARYLAHLLSEEEKTALQALSEQVLKASPEPTRICRRLAACVSQGAAFHHAGLLSAQRALVEDAFRAHQLKIIVATTTLAMGLNLPSRRIIIRDWQRYESGVGVKALPALEIKQMAGRAGRPGFDDIGEAVLIARSKRDENYLFENYIRGKPENINSQLARASVLRTHILAAIAGVFTRNLAELKDFLKNTFFAHQRGTAHLDTLAEEIVRFLADQELISVSEKGHLLATRFGHRVSELYIDPVTGIILRNALKQAKEKETFALLHLVAHTPDMMVLHLRRRDYGEMLELFYRYLDKLLVPPDEKYPTDDLLSELKTAACLMQWIQETPEDKIVGQFGIGPGDLRSLIELADWLLYAAAEIAKVFKLSEEVKNLSKLRLRVAFGVKEELLELVSLRGIGRVRARNLYNAGFKSLKDIREATVTELAQVPAIGRVIAEDIKNQVLQAGRLETALSLP
jgi:helicase